MSEKIQQKRQEPEGITHTRTVLFVLLCVVVLFILFFHCFETVKCVINQLIRVFSQSDFMTALVGFVILVGVGMWARSMLRICREVDLLEERAINGLDSHNIKALFACYEFLKGEKYNKTLLFKRLDVLLTVPVNKGGASEKKLPAMADLHEISLQSEFSNVDSAGMSTIVSVLLILGILGTLTGVHGALYDVAGGLAIGDLASAMRPSACAVLGTLLLMALRAVYFLKVDNYMGYLDSITMKRIFPMLTKEPEHQDGSELIENMKGFEALSMPDFQTDDTMTGKWNEISRASERTQRAIRELDCSKMTAAQVVPLPPKPAESLLSCFVVRPELSEERIKEGAEILSKCKIVKD